MNKLKKANLPTNKAALTSMTMQYATTSHCNPQTTVQRTQMAATVTAEEFQPQTPNEHYWAARASKAEALLTAQEAHRKEVKTLGHYQELKREVLSIIIGLERQNLILYYVGAFYSVSLVCWQRGIRKNMPYWRDSW